MLREFVKVYPLLSVESSTPVAWSLKTREAISEVPAGTPAEKLHVAELVVELVTEPLTPW